MGKVLIFKDADFSQNAIDGDKDYVLADSITFDGSHYINIGRGLTQQSKVEICFTPTIAATTESQIIVLAGVRTAALYNQLDFRILLSKGINLLSTNMLNDNQPTGGAVNNELSFNSKHTVVADIKNNTVAFDGTVRQNTHAVTGFDTGSNNLYIGAYNGGGTILSGFTWFKGDIHWIKIYDNETLSNYFHAATIKVADTPCLVDRLNDANKYYFIS
jgi:hypothetical protein